ncbi:MAG: nitrophenyl compound nitroreductase subunit ArsF family protein [Nanobdellota archaeon]
MVVSNMKSTLKMMVFVLALSIFVTGCTGGIDSSNTTGDAVADVKGSEQNITIEKLEIYHFHGANQCHSCVTVGDYAEETVNTYFEDELEDGVIVFDHVNGELPENKELVKKYGATGSSLWLGTYDDGTFTAEENTRVWYKIQDKEEYMNYLKGVIEQKLSGN